LIGKHILQYKFATSLMTKKREKKKGSIKAPKAANAIKTRLKSTAYQVRLATVSNSSPADYADFTGYILFIPMSYIIQVQHPK